LKEVLNDLLPYVDTMRLDTQRRTNDGLKLKACECNTFCGRNEQVGDRYFDVCHRNATTTGVTTLTNAISGPKPKLLRESGDFSRNRDTWKFFREARDSSGTLQKKILEFMSGILRISGKVTQKFGKMIHFRDDLR